jgi:hypothetical protein
MTPFNTRSRLTRFLSAIAAVLSTVLTLSVVVGLALHYEHNAPQPSAPMAAAPTGAAPSA